MPPPVAVPSSFSVAVHVTVVAAFALMITVVLQQLPGAHALGDVSVKALRFRSPSDCWVDGEAFLKFISWLSEKLLLAYTFAYNLQCKNARKSSIRTSLKNKRIRICFKRLILASLYFINVYLVNDNGPLICCPKNLI
jgi:hypothetical protein